MPRKRIQTPEQRAEKTKIWGANWHRANPNYQRERRKKNPPSQEQVIKSRERARRNRLEHPERIRATLAKAKSRIAAYMKKWRRENRDKVNGHKRNRYSRVRAGRRVGDRKSLCRFYRIVNESRSIPCYWCGRRTTKRTRHIDHIIPLAKGGVHAVENLCCSCADCNLRKNARLPHEFSKQGELFLTPAKRDRKQ